MGKFGFMNNTVIYASELYVLVEFFLHGSQLALYHQNVCFGTVF